MFMVNKTLDHEVYVNTCCHGVTSALPNLYNQNQYQLHVTGLLSAAIFMSEFNIIYTIMFDIYCYMYTLG